MTHSTPTPQDPQPTLPSSIVTALHESGMPSTPTRRVVQKRALLMRRRRRRATGKLPRC